MKCKKCRVSLTTRPFLEEYHEITEGLVGRAVFKVIFCPKCGKVYRKTEISRDKLPNYEIIARTKPELGEW